MAGEWIKVRTNLWDDPRIGQLCELTDRGEATVIGGLYWLWATADEHSADGLLNGMTTRTIDRKTGVTGLGAALVSIGWLTENADGVTVARFDEHNGTSAKQRAQTAKRVATHKGNAKVTQPALPESDDTVTDALPREEKIREEKKEPRSKAKPPAATFDPLLDLAAEGVLPQTAADWLAMRKAKRAPVTTTVLRNIITEVNKAGMSMDAALALACSRGWIGFQADWVLKDQRAGPSPAYQTANDKAKTWAEGLNPNRNRHDTDSRIIDINEPPARKLG